MLLSQVLHSAHRSRDLLKQLQLYPLGLRSHISCKIAWSASVDGGGHGGTVTLGRRTMLDIGVVLRAYGGYINIGDDCTINPYCVLIGSDKGLIIGNGCRIAAHSSVIAVNHNYHSSSLFIYTQGCSAKGIIIEDDVWIGAGARVLDGVILRTGTVVGAGAVVTKSTEPYTVVAGVPAKKIGKRE